MTCSMMAAEASRHSTWAVTHGCMRPGSWPSLHPGGRQLGQSLGRQSSSSPPALHTTNQPGGGGGGGCNTSPVSGYPAEDEAQPVTHTDAQVQHGNEPGRSVYLSKLGPPLTVVLGLFQVQALFFLLQGTHSHGRKYHIDQSSLRSRRSQAIACGR